MRYLFVIGLALALCGCAAAWESGYKIEAQSSEGIAFSYDPSLTNSFDVTVVAAKRCAQYQKLAIPKAQTMGILGIVKVWFVCDSREQAVTDSRIALRDAIYGSYSVVAVPQPTYPPVATFTPSPPPHSNPTDLSNQYLPPKIPHGCVGQVPVSGPGLNPCPTP